MSAADSHSLAFVANCSLLFRELPVLERPAAAAAAGFAAIEFWWPFPEPVPPVRDVDAFVAAVDDAGVRLTGLNFFAGDLAGPDCGVLSIPEREHEFLANVEVAIGIGARLGVRAFNALYGNRVSTSTAREQDRLADSNLAIAAAAADRIGATVLVEAVSGPKPYPLRTAAEALAVVARVRARGIDNIGFLCDLYHLAANGDELETLLAHVGDIAHVQVADAPGRGEPGTGSLDLAASLRALEAAGYRGLVALEYLPSTTTEASLEWLPRARRAAVLVR